MKSNAVVVSVSQGTAVISVTRQSACAKDCSSCGGCSAPNEIITVSAIDKIGVSPGDRVVIEGSTAETLRLAAVTYLLPIILFFLGYIFHPLAAAFGTLFGLGAVFAVNRYLQKRGGITIKIVDFLRGDEL